MPKHTITTRETFLFVSSVLVLIFLVVLLISSLSFLGTRIVKALSAPDSQVEAVVRFDLEGFRSLRL